MKKVVLAVVAMLAVACTKTVHETQVVYQNPPPDVLKSFSAADCTKRNCVKLERSSFGKTFLLIISAKSNGETPLWWDLKPSVVVFEKNASQVGLFALTPESIYDADQSHNLVQSFDVLNEDATSVTFDWGRGLTGLRQDPSYNIETDIGGMDVKNASTRVVDSYIRKVSMTSDLLQILQISKVQRATLASRATNPYDSKSDHTESLDSTEDTFNLDIQILPYTLNPNFKMKEADASRTVGFFVTPIGQPERNAKKRFAIMKWDLSGAKGPVRFLISANTPADYVQAVREGILYWNKVLGFEAVKVETGADDSAAPPLHSVMVRWIPWEDAGYAYAVEQADPLTGETLRGQVFMTPAWLHSKGRGKALTPVINPMVVCDFSDAPNASDADYPDNPLDLRITQDRVRGVIAHEVGHIMGLRHNFAGSASGTLTATDIVRKIKNYLMDVNDSGAMTASTVMDYIRGPDEVLLGKYVQNNALPYDQMALKWAYAADGKDLNPMVSKYCSDEDISIASMRNKVVIYECRRQDPAGSPFVSLIDDQLRIRARLLQSKYDALISMIFPDDDPAMVNSLDRVLTANHVDLFLSSLKTQVGYYYPNRAGLVSLEKWRNELWRGLKSDKDPALDLHLKQDLDEVGGMMKVKELLTPKASGWTQPDLQGVLDLIAKGQGATKGGRTYQLSVEQQAQLTQYFKDEANYVEVQMQKELNDLFKGF